MRLAKNIKRLRKEKGWTQTDLAEATGCHLSHIARIETGKYSVSLEMASKIAKALEVPIDHLVNSTEGDLADIKIEDQSFAEKIRLLNSLDKEDRMVVGKVIEAMISRKKILEFLTVKEEKMGSK